MGAEQPQAAGAQALIAQRLRETAAAAPAPVFAALAPARLTEWESDIAVVERGSDLVTCRSAPTAPALAGARRGEALASTPAAPAAQAQSDVNAATARILHFLLLQLVEQARAIERLEAELRVERRQP